MSHKAGDFKQQNKGHKTKFRTKGSIAGEAQGRMPSIKTTHASKKDHRQDRRNKANQLRKARREEAQQERIKSHAPFFIAIIDLCNAGNEQAISLFDQLAPNEVHMHGACNNKHANIYVSRLKKSVTLSVAHRDVFSALELAKVADMVLFVLTAGARPDATGTSIMTAMSLQGIPTIAHVIVSLETLSAKKRADEKRILSKLAHNSFAETKIHTLEKPSDLEALPWALLNQKHHAVRWRQARSQLFADRVEFLPDEDGTTGTLKVTGYVRSRAWNVNNLVYLPGFGAFQVSSLQSETDPLLAKKHSADEMTRVVQPDPEQQDSLQMEVPIDPLAAEQTWPTEEELQNADLEERIRRSKLKQEREGKFVLAPKGTSSYQAAWIADDEHGSEHGSDGMAHGSDENESGDDDDHGDEASDENEDIWTKLDQSKLINEHHDDDGEEHDLELVPRKEGDHIDKDKAYDDAMNVEENEAELEKLRAAEDDMKFPDEVDTPLDIPAHVRFQKYRGLASFRSSPWDPKESLPLDYARIFQFENFARTSKRVLDEAMDEELDTAAHEGQYVTLAIASVPAAFMARNAAMPLVVFNLLPHENKMSVVHFRISMHPSCTTPIKSKERLVFSTGLRTFSAGAVFSQHALGEKHKFERFFQPGATVVASVFAPIMYPPGPVLVFRETDNSGLQLVASGSLYSVNPDRLIIKRIRLSGYPLKISKRNAVVRYMFFTPEDIEWFKPVELVTKFGSRGHIKESLGTHGHMKCQFDMPIKQHDVVLMNLYKRVYPKWTYGEYDVSHKQLHVLATDEAQEEGGMTVDE